MVMPNRGEIWRVNLDPSVGHEQGGTRPGLIISANRFNHGRADLVIVLPITSSDKRIASHIKVSPPEGGLTTDSFIKCEEVRCISKERLKSRYGQVSHATMDQVQTLVKLILDLD